MKVFTTAVLAFLIGVMPSAAAPHKSMAIAVGAVGGSDVVETTDSTTTTLALSEVPQNSVCEVSVRVMAFRPSDGVSKSWLLSLGAKRIEDGDAQLLGSILQIVTPHADAGATLWTANVDISGPHMRVRVTGGLTSTIQWGASIDGMAVTYAP